jgi:hypothetical protein
VLAKALDEQALADVRADVQSRVLFKNFTAATQINST